MLISTLQFQTAKRSLLIEKSTCESMSTCEPPPSKPPGGPIRRGGLGHGAGARLALAAARLLSVAPVDVVELPGGALG